MIKILFLIFLALTFVPIDVQAAQTSGQATSKQAIIAALKAVSEADKERTNRIDARIQQFNQALYTAYHQQYLTQDQAQDMANDLSVVMFMSYEGYVFLVREHKKEAYARYTFCEKGLDDLEARLVKVITAKQKEKEI
jgi:uncharacterized membrane protein YheB (UPF0754 family)